jgi:hypothetical protein
MVGYFIFCICFCKTIFDSAALIMNVLFSYFLSKKIKSSIMDRNRETWIDAGNEIDVDITSEIGELRGLVLPRQTFHRLAETAGKSPQQIREAVGERTIRYSILMMAVQFKRMNNPFFSATRRVLLKLGSLRDVDPTSSLCTVCFETITAKCVRIPACNHSYHRPCLAKWFKFSNSGPVCPTCRATAV